MTSAAALLKDTALDASRPVDGSADATSAFDCLHWDNRFAALPAAFGTRLDPTPLPAPYRVAISGDAAAAIGLSVEEVSTQASIAILAGNRVARGSEPMAAVYSGHQFGVWAGQLGDGRAHLLGGVPGSGGSGLVELQLKGAGKTPYSRMGDGRAVLRSSIREFLCSEAMHALGIPTTRALSVIGSDQPVVRETVETAAVTVRMAPSFVRFGSFEHWASRNRHDELRILADYVIDSFYPEARASDHPYQALLASVTERTARLIAQWQAVGFCHGVMNTDNMSILGLTLDYGPFGFLDGFDAHHICNHSDEQGRYAYSRQPAVARWNLYCLADALMPLIDDVERAEAALAPFKTIFEEAMGDAMHAKLGLASKRPEDGALIESLFALLQESRADFTIFFRRLCDFEAPRDSSTVEPRPGSEVRDLFLDRERFDGWAVDYHARLALETRDGDARRIAMRAVNPKYVLRNHLAEAAIVKAREKDYSELERLLMVLRKPFDEQPENGRYADLPPTWASELEVSCSS
ncbi:MAG: protein adenylyltransferase SelO [Burkholderiaceae bacterium]